MRKAQPRGDVSATRARILDCAERLFATQGFHGSSVRDIAALAGVQFALIGYHFGSKADLLDAVIGRRSEVLNLERTALLAALRSEHAGRPVPLRRLLEGFIGPVMSRAGHGDAGWRSYTQLIATLANAAEWSALVDRHFNAVAKDYVVEVRRSCPAVSGEALLQAFFFSIGAMVAVCARSGRIETLSGGAFESNDASKLYDKLCAFLAGGFAAMA